MKKLNLSFAIAASKCATLILGGLFFASVCMVSCKKEQIAKPKTVVTTVGVSIGHNPIYQPSNK